MTNFEPASIPVGSIVLVQFPFSDLTLAKKRPALVLANISLSKTIQLITVAMVTSKIDTIGLPGDAQIEDWQITGLLFPSLIRLAKCVTLESELILSVRGVLTERDWNKVKAQFHILFSPWI